MTSIRSASKKLLLPLGLTAAAVGLAIALSGSPSNADTGGYTTATTPDEPVGSGNDNLYAPKGGHIPETGNSGETLYVTHCSSCHGVNGSGSTQAPSLIGVGAAAVDFYVGTGRMPLRADLEQAPREDPVFTQAQIDEIAKYVSDNFNGGPAVPKVHLDKGDLVEGNELFANNCAACHNSAGSGGALSGDFYAPDLFESTPTQVAEAIRIGPGAMPVFGAGTFSDHEVDSLVKYVEYLRTEETPGGLSIGKFGPVAEGFVAWIIGLGALLAISRWMGTRV